jgi:putative effector of murein hydrolase/putative effector of murein hydrolase LrgA (UPF0299 family)
MRRTAEFIATLAFLAGLSAAGTAAAAALDLPVPGPILGLIVYLLLLSFGFLPGSAVAARWLAGLLGALIVPPLVGVAAFAPVLAAGGWRLAAGGRACRGHAGHRHRHCADLPLRRRSAMNIPVSGGLVPLAVVALFVAVARTSRRLALPAALSPVVVTAAAVGLVLIVSGTPVERFKDLSQPLRFLLGPAIVALGAVVHGNRRVLTAAARPLAVAIVAGAVTGVGSAVLLARALGLGPMLIAATATRTLSTPFAILVQTRVGGPVPLAAGIAVATGAIGAIVLPPLLALLGVRDRRVVGTAVGVAAHLVGADAVGRHDPVAGAFAGAGLVGTGVVIAVLIPPLWPWLIG